MLTSYYEESGMAPRAEFSDCGRYRYVLRRDWLGFGGIVNYIMLNPSTADKTFDDHTIRRCTNLAKFNGYSGIVVTNLFAWRATKPSELLRATDPVGPRNDDYVRCEAARASIVVCAWGGIHSALRERRDVVISLLRQLGIETHTIALTKAGEPKHPSRSRNGLFLPFNAEEGEDQDYEDWLTLQDEQAQQVKETAETRQLRELLGRMLMKSAELPECEEPEKTKS